ncbi:hemagglutinin protein [Hyunsoonleella ulvae]|uniref:hemagglutinin protein n=1 Tax=Hyunsoonleella ulvae TaxID=2799948 RepID=UPI0019393108|nr:hemagglutinin protein [Hyunsoonleella ulvae]
MKNINNIILATLLLILSTSTVIAQSVERQINGSAGSTLSNGTNTVEFTVGELAVTTLGSGTVTASQGFHQAILKLSVKLSPIAYLQGASLSPNAGEENLMRDDLRIGGWLPVTSPYADALTCNASVFNTGGTFGSGSKNNNIVDWVYIELRDGTDNTSVVVGRSALLQRDGDIVDTDGISDLEIETEEGDYFVVVKHRNHLSIISNIVIALLRDVTTIVDFTDANNPITYGTNAQSTYGMPIDILGMWGGNTDNGTTVRYLGSGNDINVIKDIVLADSGNSSTSNLYFFDTYNNADINLNATVRYQGTSNDSNIIKDIVLSHPNNTSGSLLYYIKEQLPEH